MKSPTEIISFFSNENGKKTKLTDFSSAERPTP
jgi:hypothetical protein